MTSIKLTAKQTALMTQIAKGQFSYFDNGLVAGSGIWSDALTHEAGSDVAVNPRGAATVMTALCKKGLLFSDGGDYLEGEGAWVELTEAGQAWIEEFNGTEAEEVTEEEAHIGRVILEQAAAAEEVAPAAAEFAVTHRNEDGVEWETFTFADGSSVERRRKQVSGAWRTDFWGTTADGKRVYTTSKASKAAQEAGRFTI